MGVIIYNSLTLIMFFWYSCLRWTMFADKNKYPWAYTPINMFTAFLAFLFMGLYLFGYLKLMETPDWFIKIIQFIAFYLCSMLLIRFIYETVEDIIDMVTCPSLQQAFFILIDIATDLVLLFWYKYGVK